MKRINSIDKRHLRHSLFQAFGGRCAYCNVRTGLKAGTVDHYLPQALGGTNERGNLRWCCVKCNTAKADMHPDEWEQRRPAPVFDPPPIRIQLLQRIAQRARGLAA